MFNKHSGKTTTHVGHLIDVATDGATNATENWAMYMEICDAVNATEDGPKDAAKAIRKKFSVKDTATLTYTLTLLETCVKNCGKRFHLQIATKDFLQDMVKVISPKYNPSIQTQLTVLGLIQTWAYAFNKYPELKEVNKTYQDLKTKGVEFPPHDPEKASATNIPPWSAPSVVSTDVGPARGVGHAGHAPPSGVRPPPAAEMGGEMSAERVSKLHNELQTVQQNCKVFSDMLTEASNSGSTGDMELLEDLSVTCRQMQQRMQELLLSVQNEQILGELLTVNDELNNVFIRYDRFQRMRVGREGLEPPADNPQLYPPPQPTGAFNPYSPPPYPTTQDTSYPTPSSSSAAPRPTIQSSSGGPAVANLIDLDDSPQPQQQAAGPTARLGADFANLGISGGAAATGGDDFDAFAQSRTAHDVHQPPLNDKESDFMEMQKWLLENPSSGAPATSATSANISDLEFEKFLSQRQKEAENLGSVSQSAASNTNGAPPRSGANAVNNEPLFSL